MFQDMHLLPKKQKNSACPEAHGLLAWLALACLAYLASDRPRSPCLHQQQQQRRSAPPGRRRRPGCCCLGAGKASEADPRRGKPSMPRPAKQAEPAIWPKIGAFQNMVLGMMGPLRARNRVLTGPPGRESPGGADYRVGLGPNIQKWTEIFGDPTGSGQVLAGFFSDFFQNGPEWSGMASGLLFGVPGVLFGGRRQVRT